MTVALFICATNKIVREETASSFQMTLSTCGKCCLSSSFTQMIL